MPQKQTHQITGFYFPLRVPLNIIFWWHCLQDMKPSLTPAKPTPKKATENRKPKTNHVKLFSSLVCFLRNWAFSSLVLSPMWLPGSALSQPTRRRSSTQRWRGLLGESPWNACGWLGGELGGVRFKMVVFNGVWWFGWLLGTCFLLWGRFRFERG